MIFDIYAINIKRGLCTINPKGIITALDNFALKTDSKSSVKGINSEYLAVFAFRHRSLLGVKVSKNILISKLFALPRAYCFFLSLIIGCLCNTSLLMAAPVYKIDVEPVYIYKEAKKNNKIVHSLYQAKNIKVLKLHRKWAKIQFIVDNKPLIGWVEKFKLAIQTEIEPNSKAANTQAKKIANSASSTDQLAKNKYGAKAINSDLYCTKSNDKSLVNGCVVDIEVEIKGPKKSSSAKVSCQAEFEMTLVTGDLKQVWEKKKFLTPMKKGEGAARIQIAVLPLVIKSVKSITLVSYQCRLEKIN